MSRFPIFTRADVEKCYFPSLITEDFVPTHQVRLLNFRDRQVLLTDFVRLDERPTQHGVLYAYGPVESEPLYGVLSTGLWKSLTMHGHPKATQIRYQKHYIPPNEREGFVYFIQALDEGSIKIGWSQEVPRRRSELQTANAHRLVVLGTFPGTQEVEASLHARFAHLRMEGEWFRNSPEIHAFLQDSTVNRL